MCIQLVGRYQDSGWEWEWESLFPICAMLASDWVPFQTYVYILVVVILRAWTDVVSCHTHYLILGLHYFTNYKQARGVCGWSLFVPELGEGKPWAEGSAKTFSNLVYIKAAEMFGVYLSMFTWLFYSSCILTPILMYLEVTIFAIHNYELDDVIVIQSTGQNCLWSRDRHFPIKLHPCPHIDDMCPPMPHHALPMPTHPCPPMLFKLRSCIQKLCNVYYPSTPSLGWIGQIKDRSLSLAIIHIPMPTHYNMEAMPTHAHPKPMGMGADGCGRPMSVPTLELCR